MRRAVIASGLLLVALGSHQELGAQGPGPAGASDPGVVDPALYSALEYRMIGPYRGGRSTAVAGVSGEPNVFYMGSTGGGVWRTEDYGESWDNLTDATIDRLNDLLIADRDNAVECLAADQPGEISGLAHGGAITKEIEFVQHDGFPRAQGAFHAGLTFALDADQLDLGPVGL